MCEDLTEKEMPSEFYEMNFIIPREIKTNCSSDLPAKLKAYLLDFNRRGYKSVALTRVVNGRVKKEHVCDFDPKRWSAELRSAGCSLVLFSRLTIIPADHDDVMNLPSQDILRSFDILAVQANSQRSFELVCERTDTIDVTFFFFYPAFYGSD